MQHENFITDFSEVKKNAFDFRTVLRNTALYGLSGLSSLSDNTETLLKKNRIQFLYIHHIFRDEEENLRKLLQCLSKQHVFISYSSAVEKLLNGNIDKPYICVSSDDGFKNNLRAAHIMDEFGLKACFFICPQMAGEKDFNKIKKFCNGRLHFPPVEFLDWNEVEQLLKEGHEIGSHTMSHINIGETPEEEITEEINSSYQILLKHCGSVTHFAYPYGRYFNFNEFGRKTVFEAGFKSCASAERGCHITDGKKLNYDQLFIRRDHVILDWNLKHIEYFIANNSKKAALKNNLSPY